MERSGRNPYVCGSVCMSVRETEAKSDSWGFGLSNDGTDTNSNGEGCGQKKGQELSLGPMRREMPIRHASGGVEWETDRMRLELRRESASEGSACTYTIVYGTYSHRPG